MPPKETNVMTTEEAEFTIIEVPGYDLVYDAIATFVHGTPHPQALAGC